MQRWFPSYEDEICFVLRMDQLSEPLLYGLRGKHFQAMLFRVDIAMPAFQVAESQYVKEHVPGVLLECYCISHIRYSPTLPIAWLCISLSLTDNPVKRLAIRMQHM
jgi:hypothetical protein